LTRTRWEFRYRLESHLRIYAGPCSWSGADCYIRRAKTACSFVFRLRNGCHYVFSRSCWRRLMETSHHAAEFLFVAVAPPADESVRAQNIQYLLLLFRLLACLRPAPQSQSNSFFIRGHNPARRAGPDQRPARGGCPLATWVTLLLLVATVGEFSHRELRPCRTRWNRIWAPGLRGFYPSSPDQRECQTKIGRDRSRFRENRIARPSLNLAVTRPAALREATWDAYRKGTWSATQ